MRILGGTIRDMRWYSGLICGKKAVGISASRFIGRVDDDAKGVICSGRDGV